MTNWVKYQHVERLDPDNIEVQGLLNGKVYIQPKIDGTNTSVWMQDGKLCFGKRSQAMGEGDDNRGVKAKYQNDEKLMEFFRQHPDVIIYGEWLVKHTISTYLASAWNKLYIFDVCREDADGNIIEYIPYDVYSEWFYKCGISDYIIPMLDVLENPTIDDLQKYVEGNHYLLPDNQIGEGIVIKRYDYVNPYGRITWGKIVRSEFKVKSRSPFKGNEDTIEAQIVEDMFTPEFVLKEYAKIKELPGLDSKTIIPRTIGTIPYVFVTEEIGTIVKKYKKPTINFSKLYKLCESRIKEYLGW